jgi:hypothetical protein
MSTLLIVDFFSKIGIKAYKALGFKKEGSMKKSLLLWEIYRHDYPGKVGK